MLIASQHLDGVLRVWTDMELFISAKNFMSVHREVMLNCFLLMYVSSSYLWEEKKKPE